MNMSDIDDSARPPETLRIRLGDATFYAVAANAKAQAMADARAEAVAALTADRDALRATVADLTAALEAVQWSVGDRLEPRCPCCEYLRDEDGGHAKDCDLANALDRARSIGQDVGAP